MEGAHRTGIASAPDRLTVAAIAVVAYAIANFAHEGAGHGGACLLVQCSPKLLTSMQFDGDMTGISSAARRLIAAGGTFANLIVAVIAFLAWRRARSATGWFFFWLLMTISLLQATGYWLFSGIGNVGDWAVVVHDLQVPLLWHVLLAGFGGATYFLATRWTMQHLCARLHAADVESRVRTAYRYTLPAYFAGGALYVVAGSFDPLGIVIVLISGVAASFGGTSGLAWGPQLLRNPRLVATASEPLIIGRDRRWVAAGVVAALAFIAVLGPGIEF